MATKSTVSETLFRYRVDAEKFFSDQARVRESLITTLDETKKRTLSLEEAAKEINRVFAEGVRTQGLDQIIADFKEADRAGLDTADSLALVADRLSAIGASEDEVRRVAAALMDQAEATDRVAEAERERGSGGKSSGLDAGRVGSVGTQILSGLGASGAANTVGLVGDAVDAVTSLSPAMIALTAAGGALALVTSGVSDVIEENTARQRAYADALLIVADATVNGTTTAIEAQIAALENENIIRETQIQLIERQTGVSRDQLRQFQQTDTGDFTLLGMIQNFTGNLEGLGGSAATAQEAEAAIERNTFLIESLRAALADGVTTTNDAVAQAETNVAAWEDINAQIFAQMEAAFNVDRERLAFARQIDEMTAEQRAELAATLRERQADLQAAVDTFQGTGWERLPETEADLAQVNEQLAALGEVSESTADQLARAADIRERIADREAAAETRRTSATDNYLDAVETLTEAQGDLAAAEMERAELDQEHSTTLGEIADERRDREAAAEADASEARIELAEQTEKQRLEIERKAAATNLNAIGERDALASFRAKEAAKQQLEDLKESDKERDKRIAATYAKQLDAAAEYASKAAASEQAKYDRSLTAQLRAEQTAQMMLENAILNEKRLHEYSASLSVSIEAQKQSAVNAVQAQGFSASISMAQDWVNRWLAAQAYGFSDFSSPGSFDFFGMTPGQVQAGVMGSSRSVTVNAPISIAGGSSGAAVVEQALTQVRDALRIGLSGAGSAYR